MVLGPNRKRRGGYRGPMKLKERALHPSITHMKELLALC